MIRNAIKISSTTSYVLHEPISIIDLQGEVLLQALMHSRLATIKKRQFTNKN